MKRITTTGILALVIALTGCATTEKYGDARIVMKRNLMKTMTYSLNSPQFRIGKTTEYLFEYRDLPAPALPSNFIVVRYQWPNPDKGKTRPSYAETQYKVEFEDLEGATFFSTTFSLGTFERHGKNMYSRVARLYEPGKNPKPRQTYNVRITVLEPTSRKRDKAYLHSFSFGKDALY